MEMKNDSDLNSLKRFNNEHSLLDNFENGDDSSLKCRECDINFTRKDFLYDHLFQHIKQPVIKLTRSSLPPLKLTLKSSKSGNSFEIVQNPTNYVGKITQQQNSSKLEETRETTTKIAEPTEQVEIETENSNEFDSATLEDINGIIESENTEMVTGPITTDITENCEIGKESYDTIPGGEPTPPPDPSSETYPKIRIKTTGLLKDPTSCTITTEITDGEETSGNDSPNDNHLWSNSSIEDPSKLPADENILSIFNNNERAKDFGFNTSESEFMPLDRLDSRNSGALQLYNTPTTSGQNHLDSLTGLPMQALAQQVSRLQPSGNGLHQQNVLINIQQFPQAPTQAPYQSPHSLYHHPRQPMFPPPPPPPYSYQPPAPMYYPSNPTYQPPQHMQQPPPQMSHQVSQQQGNPAQMLPPPSRNSPQNQQYRQTRPPVPRQALNIRTPAQRQPFNPRGVPPTAMRQRAPLGRSRSATVSLIRGAGIRPRMSNDSNNLRGPMKRPLQEQQIKQEEVKKKCFDVLTPDKDDEDCQVICMQPKITDGFPKIESVQGASTESMENSIMHLSDSITLSVRNPPPKSVSPKKSDAKAVANILATRGITVTPTAKHKTDKPEMVTKPPTSLNLNGAVSIIPSAKQQQEQAKKRQDPQPPTVDLTDEVLSASRTKQQANSPQKASSNLGLPYRCYLCPAQYPNALGLSKHRQNYHKTSGGSLDMGIPLINLKQPGIIQKMNSLGIHNFIPLPTAHPDGTFAVPIINSKNPGNVHQMGASTMLVLGPVKTIPKPGSQAKSSSTQQK